MPASDMTPPRDSFRTHIADDLLEAYAVSRLADADLAFVEEHLLICQNCRERMRQTESYIAALRGALEPRQEDAAAKSRSIAAGQRPGK